MSSASESSAARKHTYSKRTQARMLAMQALCLFDSLGDAFNAQLEHFLADRVVQHDLPLAEPPPPESQRLARELARGAWRDRPRLDAWITRATPEWALDRLSPVDRNILRLGAYELYESVDTPPEVVIDDAVELAKLFGNTDSPGFVNVRLDALRRELGVGRRGFGDSDQPRQV
ncbi:MAG: transcription antitermination factor NusB [Planctomycetia bacterium]|nr:MAG: transcription antitermination factor NusB [Planctomycetia bacterium]